MLNTDSLSLSAYVFKSDLIGYMGKSKMQKYIAKILNEQTEVLFGYIHGSILSSDNPRDIDIAVFIDPGFYKELVTQGEVNMGFAIPLEIELERTVGKKVDVQLLNQAPLGFQYQVINGGILVTDKDSDIRADFECMTRVKYFDFRPRVQEYLQEIMT
jgi:predicted nucleotidyltransferase